MKVSVLFFFFLALQACLPATMNEANVCDGLPAVKEASYFVNDDPEEQPAPVEADNADKTLMMYRLLHTF